MYRSQGWAEPTQPVLLHIVRMHVEKSGHHTDDDSMTQVLHRWAPHLYARQMKISQLLEPLDHILSST
jgi:hypothetical protein